MKCPLLRRLKVGEHGPYVVLLEDRDGAGNENTGSHFAGEGEKDHAMAGSRKNGGRDGAVEKTRGGMSSRQGCESSEVKVLVPPIACSRAGSMSDACGGNEARSART
jgi:hypothetical protein